MIVITQETIKSIKAQTIGETKYGFQMDYGDYDEEDDDRIEAEKYLQAYCDGANDVLKIIEKFVEE